MRKACRNQCLRRDTEQKKGGERGKGEKAGKSGGERGYAVLKGGFVGGLTQTPSVMLKRGTSLRKGSKRVGKSSGGKWAVAVKRAKKEGAREARVKGRGRAAGREDMRG